MSADDVVRLDIVGLFNFQEVTISHHIRYLTNAATEADLLAAWTTACQAAYLALEPGNFTLQGLSALQVWPGPLDNQRGPTGVNRNLTGTTNFGAGDYAPSWFAEDIRVFTAGRGRSRHGRFFPLVPHEGLFTQDQLSASWITLRNAYLTALSGFCGPTGTSTLYKHGIYSRKHAYLPPPNQSEFNPSATINDVFRAATVYQASGVLTTQRSRRP